MFIDNNGNVLTILEKFFEQSGQRYHVRDDKNVTPQGLELFFSLPLRV